MLYWLVKLISYIWFIEQPKKIGSKIKVTLNENCNFIKNGGVKS